MPMFQTVHYEENDGTSLGVGYFVILVVLALICITTYLIVDRIKTNQWKKGIFPVELKFNKENLLQVYICLSASMIRRDIKSHQIKSDYTIDYFKKEFPESKSDFKASLNFALRHPIQLKSVCDWVNLHMKDEIYRLQIIYFLAGLSMVNGKLYQEEYRLLEYLSTLLEIQKKDFDSVVAMYYKQKDGQKAGNKRSKTRSKSKTKITQTKTVTCLKILGLKENSTFEEIKKAHRKLVMKHHPDKFETEGHDQLRIAKERFLKIQEAYEYLERVYK